MQMVNPPQSIVDPVTEILHGVAIQDPYRWLEDQTSPRTRDWLEEQGAYLRGYLGSIPSLEHIKQRVEELLAVESISALWDVRGRYFFSRRLPGQEQSVIVMRNGLFGRETILLDPSTRTGGASTAVGIAAISEDCHFLAYSVRQGGTDHSSIEIFDIQKNQVLPDRLSEGFCTGFMFAPDSSGFYYSHRELHDPRPNYRAVVRHRFGTDQSEDQEVFFAGETPDLCLRILHSPEAKLLAYAVFFTGKQPSTSIYIQETQQESAPKLLLHNIEGCFAPFFFRDQLLAYTDTAAPNCRVVRIEIGDPTPTHWRDVVPESNLRIQQCTTAGDEVFVTRVDRFSTRVQAYKLDGSQKEDLLFRPYGTINFINRTSTSDILFFNYSSVSTPPSIYCYETVGKTSFVWEETRVQFNPSIIASEELVYTSRDGVSVPIFLAAKKDLLHSGPLPTFLTGYGGFGNCVTQRFTAFASFLIEQGLLLAVPALRGGSELGEQWHLAGRREKRQNSFHDFIAAAEWLLTNGRSAPGRIAIGGGSNAGLLVGAVITQRPDLFRAAICLGPLLDMTRYHLFDFAAGWTSEYGSPDDEEDFQALLAYSPYHRVQGGVRYPAVLFISGDADTRCNPMHARKMTARLQAASTSGFPTLLDYRPAWGHTPVQPRSTRVDALTNRLAFVCHELGVEIQPRKVV